ncbi:helix-turn-helix transcriptional regulator [Streptomyces sp. NPDC088725]|uniref:helix-turn-helix transcriptional regulator n=1 Tax=Streptomyces sp. NPDC088725 TaxID=3365873 RepID=UPI0037F21740
MGELPALPDFPDDAHGDAVVWRNRAMALFDRVPVPGTVCRTDGTILLANTSMAQEWRTSPGRLRGRNVLGLLRPSSEPQLEKLKEALRLGHSSRYPIAVSWPAADGSEERYGELTVDPMSDSAEAPRGLLVLLRVLGERERPSARPAGERDRVSPVDGRLLALAAGGATTEAIARAVGMTADGVNYHFGRLARLWGVPGRTALVARAYAFGVLDANAWPPTVT